MVAGSYFTFLGISVAPASRPEFYTKDSVTGCDYVRLRAALLMLPFSFIPHGVCHPSALIFKKLANCLLFFWHVQETL